MYVPSMILATLSSTLAIRSSTPATRSSTLATLSSMSSTVFTTPLTLSSTLCVAFKFCTTAIRASSTVNLSSFFTASSISVIPISLFKYFSELPSVNGHILIHASLTHSALLQLLRGDPNDRENLDRYLNHHIHHLLGRLYFRVDFKTSEEHFDALKDVQKCILACPNVLNCLNDISRYDEPTHRYRKGYALKGGRQLQQKSHSGVKIPVR